MTSAGWTSSRCRHGSSARSSDPRGYARVAPFTEQVWAIVPSCTGLRFPAEPQWIRDHLYWSNEVNRYIAENDLEAFDGTLYPSRPIWWNKGEFLERTKVKSEHGAPSPTTNLTWSDRNGDGLVQQDEVTYLEAPGVGPTGFEGGMDGGRHAGFDHLPKIDRRTNRAGRGKTPGRHRDFVFFRGACGGTSDGRS